MAVPALPSGYALQEYRIERLLGAGGFGLTYLAIDTNLQPEGGDQGVPPVRHRGAQPRPLGRRPTPRRPPRIHAGASARFLDESRTVASFRHPNIVRVMRFFEAKGSAYMVMEYVEGDAAFRLTQAAPAAARSPGHGDRRAAAAKDCRSFIPRATCTATSSRATSTSATTAARSCSISAPRAHAEFDDLTAIVTPGYAPFEQYHSQGSREPGATCTRSPACLYWVVTGERPLEAAARVRQDTMPPALKAGDRNRYRPEFLAAIDWGLRRHEDDRPQSVHEWRAALAGTMKSKLKRRNPRRRLRRLRPPRRCGSTPTSSARSSASWRMSARSRRSW